MKLKRRWIQADVSSDSHISRENLGQHVTNDLNALQAELNGFAEQFRSIVRPFRELRMACCGAGTFDGCRRYYAGELR